MIDILKQKMEKKVIYSGFSEEFWLDVVDNLRGAFGWSPCYWVGSSKTEQQVISRFPEITFHDATNAVKGVPPAAYVSKRLNVIDKPLLDGLAQCEIQSINMMDRMDALGSFTYHDRLRHYYNLLRYWTTVLDDLNPDIVIFKEIPHLVYDYVLYEICKLKGVKTIMFQISNLRRIWILMDSIYGENEVMKEYKALLRKRPNSPITLSAPSEQYIKSFRGDAYENIPRFTRFVEKKDFRSIDQPLTWKQKALDFRNYRNYIKKQQKIFKNQFSTPRNYLKEPGKTVEKSAMSWLEYRFFRYKSRKKMRYLTGYYHRLTQPLDLTRPFIYVALTYQPEANSSPKGGSFSDLRLMVDLMARHVPDGWSIYVKEHPSQLHPAWSFRSQSARRVDFYDDLAAIENVRLVPLETSPFDLIDHSQAVATLTGTSAFQAVNRGKPAFIFGYPWYRGCEGVFHIETVQAFNDALGQIQTGYSVDLEKVSLFIYALEKVGVSDYIEEKWQHFFPDSNDAISMAKNIQEFSNRS